MKRTKVGRYFARLAGNEVIIETEGRTREEAVRMNIRHGTYVFDEKLPHGTYVFDEKLPRRVATFTKEDVAAIRESPKVKKKLADERKKLAKEIATKEARFDEIEDLLANLRVEQDALDDEIPDLQDELDNLVEVVLIHDCYEVSYGKKTVRVGCTRINRKTFDKLARGIK